MCVGVVLAVNGAAVEGRNMSNDSPFRSQKRCFTAFYSVLFYLHTFTIAMLNCQLSFFVEFQ